MELKIGDYVDYTPTPAIYPADKLGADYTGYANTGDLTTDTDLKWRILGVDEKGCLTIISDKPTSKTVSFQDAKGYNNGVYILNDICKTLYSSTDLGVSARSLTIEDVEGGFSPTAEAERDSFTDTDSNTKYKQPYTYTGSSAQYPAIYAKENGSGIGVEEANQDKGRKTDGIGGSEAFYNENQLSRKPDDKESDSAENLTCTQTDYRFDSDPTTYCKNDKFYEMIFNTGTYYWLASRCVDCSSSIALFNLHTVDRTTLGAISMFHSDGDTSGYYIYLRPAVSLGSDIKLTLCDGGNNAENPHTLSKASS